MNHLPDDVETQIERLHRAIAALEAQRASLGDATVDAALVPLNQQIAALAAQADQHRIPSPRAQPRREERRIITILFSDVVGSVSLAEQLDPEDWKRTIGAVQSTIGEIVARHQGIIAEYQGDGVIAFFGAQEANERDAENALLAGLAAQAAVSQLDLGMPLQIRVGIHTGLVVLEEWGADARIEFGAFGDAVNVAARLQSSAEPGTVLISHDTYRQVRGIFEVTPQPPLTVKGKQEPIQTYLVHRPKLRAFHMPMRGVAGVEARTVGREREFQALQTAFLNAYQNRAIVWAQLSGEAGLGKSRLVDDLCDWLELRPEMFRLLRARAFAGDSSQPLALVRRMWFDRFKIAEDAPLPDAEANWTKGFRDLSGIQGQEPAHALGLLLGLPFQDSPFIGAMRQDPTQVRGRALVVSRELLRAMRRELPVVVLLEDLHWADAASWEYMREVLLTEEQEGSDKSLQGLFILTTARSEWTPPPPSFPQTKQIPLAPLSDAATFELVRELLRHAEGVPEPIFELIVQRAEGVPYYVVELINWFLDRGILDASSTPWRFVPQHLEASPLPVTLHHLLLTHLSTLSQSERDALQRGSIFGRRFWSRGVEALGVRRSTELLLPLQARGMIQAQPESSFVGEKEWSFHHALLRDVTYESVLKQERGGLHSMAAQWLEEQAGRAGRLDEFAGVIGEHCERAGELSDAADWYLRAGEQALRSAALVEARRLFDRTLEFLPPLDRERRWRGLLGREAVLNLRGEREAQKQDIEALLELADALDNDRLRCQASFRQCGFYAFMGDGQAVLAATERMIATARRAGDSALEVNALARQTVWLLRLGDIATAQEVARETLERARALQDQAALGFALSRLATYYTEIGDIGRGAELSAEVGGIARRIGDRVLQAASGNTLAHANIQLGMYEQARTAAEQALAQAEAIGSRRSVAYDLLTLAEIDYRLHDGRTARTLAEKALAAATAVGDAILISACWLDLALIAEQAGDYGGAARQFDEAGEQAERLGLPSLKILIEAGRARCALAEGHLEEAHQRAVEVWNYLSGHGMAGVTAAMFAFSAVAHVLRAVREPELEQTVVQVGYNELMQRANKITDLKWRKSFLENVEWNRALVERWEQMQR